MPDAASNGKRNGHNWPNLIAGALTGVASIGAGIAIWSSGNASRSASNAKEAQYVTLETALKARDRLDAFEREQRDHDRQIEELVKRLEALEGKGAKER